MKELIEIQRELKAPKSQKNSFGNYYYRSCEDILEAAKPICHKHGCALTIFDEVIMLGDRFYVKAYVQLSNGEGKIVAASSAYARESETKKGMDTSQITGSTSSYARKYALNGLFCIDDTKDAETRDNSDNSESAVIPATNRQLRVLMDYVVRLKSAHPDKAAQLDREIDKGLMGSTTANERISRCAELLGAK